MPPQVEWHDDVGLRARWDEIDTIVEPHWYSFVEERHFPARDLDKRLELPARNVTLLRETERATDYAAIESRVINRSVNVDRIEKASGRAVTISISLCIKHSLTQLRGVQDGRRNTGPKHICDRVGNSPMVGESSSKQYLKPRSEAPPVERDS
jgi:hypothetical protein